VIIDDFHIMSVSRSPAKAQAPLSVDSDTVLPFPITSQFLEPVRRRNPQIIERSSSVHHQELAQSDPLNGPEPPGPLPPEDLLGLPAAEPFDHALIVTPCDIIVKRYYAAVFRRPAL
jgi:hypothetical protein